MSTGFHEFETWEQAEDEVERLRALLNNPEYEHFIEGVKREAGHQVERWGTPHDRAKEPEDWLFLIGYLAGKACHAQREQNRDKALHHCVSSAAVLLNWHRHIVGTETTFTPGDSDLQKHLEEVFGPIEED